MVNAPATAPSDRRERPRAPASGSPVLGVPKLNPLGDLHTLQHLCARLARTLRPVFEPVLRDEIRAWAEPLVVQRFADYRAERGETLGAWLPLAMTGANAPGRDAGHAVLVFEGGFVLRMLDLFFGGAGAVPATLPPLLSPAAEALIERLGAELCRPLAHAWEPLARIGFAAMQVEANPAALAEAEDAVVVTRFGLAAGAAAPAFVDILYPVAALKPHAATLAGKVVDKAEPDPAWRHRLTRAAMDVCFPIRSVLAEPVVPLSRLMNLQVGDVIPISFGQDVPVMIGREPLGTGTVGTANGRAAVRLTTLARNEGPDQ